MSITEFLNPIRADEQTGGPAVGYETKLDRVLNRPLVGPKAREVFLHELELLNETGPKRTGLNKNDRKRSRITNSYVKTLWWYYESVRRKLFILQSFLLLSGTIFSWTNVLNQFDLYFEAGGKFLQFTGCPVRNPIVTPCLWGAIAFLISFLWSLHILRQDTKRRIKTEYLLRWFLVASTIFGWGNVASEFYRYYSAKMQPIVSCSGKITHPIFAPCFTGSILFLASLLLSDKLVEYFKKHRLSKNF